MRRKKTPIDREVILQPTPSGWTNQASKGTNRKLPTENPIPPKPIANVLFLSNRLLMTDIIGSQPPAEAPNMITI